MRRTPPPPKEQAEREPVSRFRQAIALVLAGGLAGTALGRYVFPYHTESGSDSRSAIVAPPVPPDDSQDMEEGTKKPTSNATPVPAGTASGQCMSPSETEVLLKARDIRSRIIAKIKGELGEEEEWQVSNSNGDVLEQIEKAMERGCLRFKAIHNGKLELENPDAKNGDITSCTIDLQSYERQQEVVVERVKAAYPEVMALVQEEKWDEAIQAFSTDPILAEARADGAEEAPFVMEAVNEIERAKTELREPLSSDQKRVKICQLILRFMAMMERGDNPEGGAEGHETVNDFLGRSIIEIYLRALVGMLGEGDVDFEELCMEELGEQPICAP